MLRDERWHMIRNMVENGMKISEIAKELNIDRKTVKKYTKSKAVPKQKQRKKRSLKLEPYMDYIKERIAKYNLSAMRILEEIRKKLPQRKKTEETLKINMHNLRQYSYLRRTNPEMIKDYRGFPSK